MFRKPYFALVGVVFLFAARPARADLGPKFDDHVYFNVTLNGEPLPDASFDAALLRYYPPGSEARARADNSGRSIPSLGDLPADESGGRWSYANYKWGGRGGNGRVDFHGFYYDGGIPDRVRLAVYLPSQQKLYVTDVAPTHPLLRTYRADLRPDGGGTLTLNRSGAFAVDWLWGLWQLGFGPALALTLLAEGLVVWAYARWWDATDTRLVRICLVANVLTLPVVWVATVIGFNLPSVYWSGLGAFAGVELFVTALEGLAYATLGRLGWSRGMALACLANAASVGVGVVVGFVA
jgi:hypothetical protein